MNESNPEITSRLLRVFDWLGHRLTWLAFGLAIFVYIAAPIMALSWRNTPFPGFFIEQTLVINQNNGENWSGRLAGMMPGEHVTRIGGITIYTPEEYHNALSTLEIGQKIAVFTTLPDGSGHLYPSVTIETLSNKDFIRFFWLPYFIGLIYLGIGGWIYRIRGKTRSGLALTLFCVLISIVCGLIFDLSTTHLGSAVWIVALSTAGTAMINLAMCFPKELAILRKKIWVLAIPFGVSILLSAWNLLVLNDLSHPWAYQAAWGITYRFLAFGILCFIGVMLFHTQKSKSPTVRRQTRIVLLGSSLAFTPLMIWFIAPILGLPLNFNVSLLLPPLILFPISVSIAILRYRLWEIDTLVNRTIVYGLLTAIMAGLFTALGLLSQRMFVILTGEKSDAAIIITTLIVGSAFAPIRGRLQTFVDRQFKELPDQTKALQAFGEQVRSFVQMNNVHQLTLRLLTESAEALHAESGALALVNGNQSHPQTVHTYRQWKGEVIINMPIDCDGHRYGYLLLGPRMDSQPYTQVEYQVLKQVSDQIAIAIQLRQRNLSNGQNEDLESTVHGL